MKTRNILLALSLMLGSGLWADETRTINVSYSTADHEIPLPIVERIYFEDGNVVVTTTMGSHTFPISAINKITFGTTDDATAIAALPEEAEGIAYTDGKLAVSQDGLLRVYGTGGALVSVAQVKEGERISLAGLPAGVYVVRMGDKTIKVRK